MKRRKVILRFRAANRDIFKAICRGEKKIETRAATKRYRDIKTGDIIVLVCDNEKIERTAGKIELFKSIDAILKKYKPETINPKTRNKREAAAMWRSFPGYREKIKNLALCNTFEKKWKT